MTDNATSYQIQKYGTAPIPVKHKKPNPVGREVLVKVSHVGVCHSDVYIMDGFQDLGEGERLEFADTSMPIPLTMGHEIVGDVEEVGSDADGSLVGNRRLIYPWIGCGTCPTCQGGKENHCEDSRNLGIFRDGGYGSYVIVPDSKYLVDIGDIDPAWACTLACSGLTMFSAFKQLQPPKPESYTAIVGMGGLGLMAVALAKAIGHENIVACDISDERLDTAKRLGAAAVVNTMGDGAADRLRAATNGRLYGVIDTVGIPTTVQIGIDTTLKGGRVILVGLQGGRIPLQLPILPLKALSVIGTYTGALDELLELVDIAKSGALQPMPVDVKPMACLHETLEDLRAGNVVGRVVLQP